MYYKLLMAYQIFDNFVTASLCRKLKCSSDEHQAVGLSWEHGNGGQLFEANEKKRKSEEKVSKTKPMN